MDAELKAKWVEALRGGDYDQAQTALRRGNSFCCLGVLCDVAKLGDWLKIEADEDGDIDDDGYLCEFSPSVRDDSLLPHEILRKIGFDEDKQETCWKMNDEQNQSFAAIADWIEKNL